MSLTPFVMPSTVHHLHFDDIPDPLEIVPFEEAFERLQTMFAPLPYLLTNTDGTLRAANDEGSSGTSTTRK